MSLKLRDKRKLISLLKKFSAKEFVVLTEPLFKSFTWQDVKEQIGELHLTLSAHDIASVILELYLECGDEKPSLEKLFVELQFYDVIYHDSQLWQGVQLTDQSEEVVSDPKEVIQRIENAFRRQRSQTVRLDMIEMEGLIWGLFAERYTSGRLSSPVYFVFNPSLELPYLFVSPPKTNQFIIELLAHGFGFDEYRKVDLDGRDVRSLFGMVTRKQTMALTHYVPPFNPDRVVDRGHCLDYTLGRQREQYAQIVLPGLTNLKTITFECTSEWRGRSHVAELCDEESPITVRLSLTSGAKDKSVEDLLRHMVAVGIIGFPLPSYITSLPVIAKNKLRLK